VSAPRDVYAIFALLTCATGGPKVRDYLGRAGAARRKELQTRIRGGSTRRTGLRAKLLRDSASGQSGFVTDEHIRAGVDRRASTRVGERSTSFRVQDVGLRDHGRPGRSSSGSRAGPGVLITHEFRTMPELRGTIEVAEGYRRMPGVARCADRDCRSAPLSRSCRAIAAASETRTNWAHRVVYSRLQQQLEAVGRHVVSAFTCTAQGSPAAGVSQIVIRAGLGGSVRRLRDAL